MYTNLVFIKETRVHVSGLLYCPLAGDNPPTSVCKGDSHEVFYHDSILSSLAGFSLQYSNVLFDGLLIFTIWSKR